MSDLCVGNGVELTVEVRVGHIWICFEGESPQDSLTDGLWSMREIEVSQVIEWICIYSNKEDCGKSRYWREDQELGLGNVEFGIPV